MRQRQKEKEATPERNHRLDVVLGVCLRHSLWSALAFVVLSVSSAFGQTLTDSGIPLTGVWNCSLAWGDYDNDGDLDLALAGSDNSYTAVSKLYRNNNGIVNSPPSAPTGLAAAGDGVNVTFSWAAAADNETPAAGLSYNLRVGTRPGTGDIFSGMAAGSGLHKLRPSATPKRGSSGPSPYPAGGITGAFRPLTPPWPARRGPRNTA